MSETRKYTLSILVDNEAGVLSQVTRLFSRKRYNIESLAVGTTDDERISRITIITPGDEQMIRHLESQLNKLISVISVEILQDELSIYREFMMIKVRVRDKDARDEIIQIVNVFRASIVDISRSTLMIAITGTESKTQALLKLLGDFGILEIARTGIIALERGERTIYDNSKSRAACESGQPLQDGGDVE